VGEIFFLIFIEIINILVNFKLQKKYDINNAQIFYLFAFRDDS